MRVLQIDGYTPVQDLLPDDFIKRQTFARYILNNNEQDELFLNSILWTDESQFTREGANNFHNLHTWSQENPHSPRVVSSQYRFSVNVWAGIIGHRILGPIFLPNRLNGPLYLEHLNEVNHIIEEEVPVGIRNRIIYQHDGAPPHVDANVTRYLNREYNNRWIGRFGPIIVWPPRSPDLTPLDFFLWSGLKTEVYRIRVNTREESSMHSIQQNNVWIQLI